MYIYVCISKQWVLLFEEYLAAWTAGITQSTMWLATAWDIGLRFLAGTEFISPLCVMTSNAGMDTFSRNLGASSKF
jgi:hypothetical protein